MLRERNEDNQCRFFWASDAGLVEKLLLFITSPSICMRLVHSFIYIKKEIEILTKLEINFSNLGDPM